MPWRYVISGFGDGASSSSDIAADDASSLMFSGCIRAALDPVFDGTSLAGLDDREISSPGPNVSNVAPPSGMMTVEQTSL